MKTVLIADDETLFTQSVSEGLTALDPSLRVLTAENGLEARRLLDQQRVDLVLTDLKMPVMDGFELLSHLVAERPGIPALVMTAFGTPEIGERLRRLGIGGFIEKPVEFAALADRVLGALRGSASGFVRGIPLPTFLQVIEMERKTCALRVATEDGTGLLHFVNGSLWDAEAGDLRGEAAASAIVCWEGASIEILNTQNVPERTVRTGLGQLLLDSMRRADEARRAEEPPFPDTEEAGYPPETDRAWSEESEERIMAATDKMKELTSIDGFAGAGVYTPTGEALAVLSGTGGFTKEIGILANSVLMNAQKACLEMGAGRGQLVHIEGEKAQVIARCLNEGTDPLKSAPGKAHIHMVMALSSDSSIGLAKLRMNQTIEKLAEDFRA